jgi:hypothetical protein
MSSGNIADDVLRDLNVRDKYRNVILDIRAPLTGRGACADEVGRDCHNDVPR